MTGQQNLKDRKQNDKSWGYSKKKKYSLKDKTAVLLVRPRGLVSEKKYAY
jgi:malate synthase